MNKNAILRLICLCAIIALLCAGCATEPPNEFAGSISIELGDEYLTLHTPTGDHTIRYANITQVNYLSSWKAGEFASGIENDFIKSGEYMLADEGDFEYQLHIYTDVGKYLALTYNNGNVLVFNLETVEELLECQNELTPKAFSSTN